MSIIAWIVLGLDGGLLASMAMTGNGRRSRRWAHR
jgi:uncharacterized membrane protein YeaQ/YmgE (transglycosylase-associated protein family)